MVLGKIELGGGGRLGPAVRTWLSTRCSAYLDVETGSYLKVDIQIRTALSTSRYASKRVDSQVRTTACQYLYTKYTCKLLHEVTYHSICAHSGAIVHNSVCTNSGAHRAHMSWYHLAVIFNYMYSKVCISSASRVILLLQVSESRHVGGVWPLTSRLRPIDAVKHDVV